MLVNFVEIVCGKVYGLFDHWKETFRMSSTITLEEAQAQLPELIAQLGPGEEIVIISN